MIRVAVTSSVNIQVIQLDVKPGNGGRCHTDPVQGVKLWGGSQSNCESWKVCLSKALDHLIYVVQLTNCGLVFLIAEKLW